MISKTILPAARMLVVLTIVTGVIYPLVVTVLAQVVFPVQANGSLVVQQDQVVGSALIGQSGSDPRYFWGRPSAVNYNPMPSGGSNAGATSAALAEAAAQREADFRAVNNIADAVTVPSEMLFASASGLYPHISPDAARLQVERVAEARGLDAEQVAALVEEHIEGPQFGFLGQPRVNVLLLNLALDALE